MSKAVHPGVCLLVLLGPSVANPNLQSLTQEIEILNEYSFGLGYHPSQETQKTKTPGYTKIFMKFVPQIVVFNVKAQIRLRRDTDPTVRLFGYLIISTNVQTRLWNPI